jgi:PAS domain S-box-containing protein
VSDLDPPLRTPGRDASPPLAEGSAWALAAVLLGLGVLALLSTLLPWLMGWLPELNPRRATVGAALLVFALGVELLRRAGHPRFGSALALVGMLALSAWYSVVSGLGVHSVVQAAGVLMIVLAGLYIGAGAAISMGVLALALLMVLALAERTGALPGLGLPWALTVERVLTLAVLLIGATITAVLLARLLARSIAAAQQGEQRYRELLELGADWYWELDAKGRIVAISPTFEALSGRTVAEFLQTQQPGGPQVQDDAEYQAVLATMRRREAHRNRQLTWRCADGTELVVASSGEPRLDTAGRFVGWRGTGRNITEEVRTRRWMPLAAKPRPCSTTPRSASRSPARARSCESMPAGSSSRACRANSRSAEPRARPSATRSYLIACSNCSCPARAWGSSWSTRSAGSAAPGRRSTCCCAPTRWTRPTGSTAAPSGPPRT